MRLLQLGEFTLKRHAMTTLPQQIECHPDFMDVFGGAGKTNSGSGSGGRSHALATIGAAEVKNSEHRQWLRLVGRRHDVQVGSLFCAP